MLSFSEPDLQAKLEYYRDRRLSPAIVEAFYDESVKRVQALYPTAAPAGARALVIELFFRECREASAEKLETLEVLDRHLGDATDDMVDRFGIGVFVERADGSDRMRWAAFSRQRDFAGTLEIVRELTTETRQPAIRSHRREAGCHVPNNGTTKMPWRTREPSRYRDGDAAFKDWADVRTILAVLGRTTGAPARAIVLAINEALGYKIGRDRVRRAINYGLHSGEVLAVGGRTNRTYVLTPVGLSFIASDA